MSDHSTQHARRSARFDPNNRAELLGVDCASSSLRRAYRLDCDGASLCYVTDTAPFKDILIEQEFIRQPPKPGDPLKPEDAAKLQVMREGVVRLCEGADLVIYDTQFTPEEYRARPHWGHSCPEDAI